MKSEPLSLYGFVREYGKLDELLTDTVMLNPFIEWVRAMSNNEPHTDIYEAIKFTHLVLGTKRIIDPVASQYASQLFRRQDFVEICTLARLLCSIKKLEFDVVIDDDYIFNNHNVETCILKREHDQCSVGIVWRANYDVKPRESKEYIGFPGKSAAFVFKSPLFDVGIQDFSWNKHYRTAADKTLEGAFVHDFISGNRTFGRMRDIYYKLKDV